MLERPSCPFAAFLTTLAAVQVKRNLRPNTTARTAITTIGKMTQEKPSRRFALSGSWPDGWPCCVSVGFSVIVQLRDVK